MRSRAITLTVLLAALALVAAAAPAGAKKPPKDPKPDEPVTHTVSLAFAGEEPGLDGAGCVPGAFTMSEQRINARGTALIADGRDANEDGIADSDQVDLDLVGTFGEMTFERGVCDHSTNPDSPGPTYGMVWITFDRHGAIQDFLWHFEMRMTEDWRLIERWTLVARDDLTWDDNGIVFGTFDLGHWGPGTIGTELVGTTTLTFEMTID